MKTLDKAVTFEK